MEKSLYKYVGNNFSIRRTVTTGEGDYVSFELHSHNAYEVFLLSSEKASFFAEGTIYQMSKGDVMIFNSSELHNISFDNSCAYERLVIHFQPEAVLAYNSAACELLHIFTARKPGKGNYFPKNCLEQTDFYGIAEKLDSVAASSDEFKDIYCQTLFLQLLIAINQASALTANCEYPLLGNEKIRRILSYINNNLTEDLSLDILSEEFFINKYSLCHLFKTTTGFTVKQYIAYRRIAMAQKFMANGQSTLDACIASGFNDYSNFYKTFKKILGKPPKKFK